MNYKLLEFNNSKDMEQAVNASVAQGWKLHGTLIVHCYPSSSPDQWQIDRPRVGFLFLQAMILE